MIIGFCGLKGSGKDTAAKYLVENYGYTRMAFADKLKESVAALFNIPLEWVDQFKDDRGGTIPRVEVLISSDNQQYSFSWREFLQRYGTESHRSVFGTNFWVDLALPYYHERYMYLEKSKEKLVFSDTRFPNEHSRIQTYGGLTILIERPGMYQPRDSHVSEQINFVPDFRVVNAEDNLEVMHKYLDKIMEDHANLNK